MKKLFVIMYSVGLIAGAHEVRGGANLVQAYQRLSGHVAQLRALASKYRAMTMPPEVKQPVQYCLEKHCAYAYQQELRGVSFLQNGYIHFTHTDVVACVAVMQQEERMDAFFVMWDQFSQKTGGQNFAPEDELFLKDCGTLVLLFYNNMLQTCSNKPSRISVDDIIQMYDAIAKLPIDELLDLLDAVLDRLLEVLNNATLPANQDTMFEWLQSNWWIPPVVIGALVVQVLML